MKIELYLQNSNTGNVYDISQIAEQIKVSKAINGSAGQLTCVLQKDPNDILEIANGSSISFIVNGKGIFFGYVFKIGTDADANYKITCYDQLRYLKNTDIYTFKDGETASQIFEKICKDYNLKYEVKAPTKYIPTPYQFINKSLYSIIERGMQLANVNEVDAEGKHWNNYYIIDNFGTLTWTNTSNEELQIYLGDNSLVTSFTYERSIDNDTYNRVKLYREDKDAGKINTWVVYDSDNIKRWGILQYLKQASDGANSAQVQEQAKNYLATKNRETETLKIQAEGIIECEAGKRIKFVLEREKIDKWMWIKSSTHTFTKYEHTMDLEVEI